MFNTEIYLSTFIYILILIFLIVQVLFSKTNKAKHSYKIRLLLLLFCTLIYNIVEGLLPDENFPIDLVSQNIIAFFVGITTAFYTLFYLKTVFSINIIKPFNVNSISYLVSISFVSLFIIPYSITQDLNFSRNLFLITPLILLLLSVFYTMFKQYRQIKEQNNWILKLHLICGIIGLMGVTSLPIIILIFGDNQFIEQTCYTLGIFALYVDYLFYSSKNIISEEINYLDNLTAREKECFELVINNPNSKHSEISELLCISEKTFSTHMSNIYKKIKVKNKKELQRRYNNDK